MRVLYHSPTIGLGETLKLKPDSFHVIFIDPTKVVKAGQIFKCTVRFEKVVPVDLTFVVAPLRRMTPTDPGTGQGLGAPAHPPKYH